MTQIGVLGPDGGGTAQHYGMEKDVDLVMLYDAFTINTLLFLEDRSLLAVQDAHQARTGRYATTHDSLAAWPRPVPHSSR